MTIEEQIMKLQTYKMFEGEDTVYVERDDVLKLLEQQTCEDAISKHAVLETIDSRIEQIKRDADAINKSYSHLSFAEGVYDGYCRLKCDLWDLPSITPKFTDAEIQKMQELEQAQLEKAYELGKAEIQPSEDYIRELIREFDNKHPALFVDYVREFNNHPISEIIEYMWDMHDLIEDIEDLLSVTPQTNEDCISRTALLAKIDEERKHLLALEMDGAEHILVHHARRIIEDMPSVTPKAELWNKLYLWLNDMHLGISLDEFTPDDERKCRTAQTDIIEDVMGWIEANVFEPKAGSED